MYIKMTKSLLRPDNHPDHNKLIEIEKHIDIPFIPPVGSLVEWDEHCADEVDKIHIKTYGDVQVEIMFKNIGYSDIIQDYLNRGWQRTD